MPINGVNPPNVMRAGTNDGAWADDPLPPPMVDMPSPPPKKAPSYSRMGLKNIIAAINAETEDDDALQKRNDTIEFLRTTMSEEDVNYFLGKYGDKWGAGTWRSRR